MTTPVPTWVQIGAEVMSVRSSISGTSYGARHKIAKVYKNGNFTLAGDTPEQWRPVRDYASRAGKHYGNETMWPVTPHLEAEAAKAEAVCKARRIVRVEAERLESIRDDDGLLAAAAAITARQSEATK